MGAQQRQLEAFQGAAVKDLSLQARGDGADGGEIGAIQRRALFVAGVLDHRFHRGLLAVEGAGPPGLDDAGFRLRDGLHGVAQELRVVQADVGDDGALGVLDGVRRVPVAAHAHLQHHDVALLPLEVLEAQGGDQLELRGMLGHGVGMGPHVFRQCAQVVVGDLNAVHLHALVEADDVGRGVEPRAIARPREDGGQHRRGGALAVGARDVNELQVVLRVAQPREQLPDPLQSRDRPEPGDAVDIIECFGDVHMQILRFLFPAVFCLDRPQPQSLKHSRPEQAIHHGGVDEGGDGELDRPGAEEPDKAVGAVEEGEPVALPQHAAQRHGGQEGQEHAKVGDLLAEQEAHKPRAQADQQRRYGEDGVVAVA